VELAQVGETGERGEVDAQADEFFGRDDCLVIAPELDERVDFDGLRGYERRRELEGPMGRRERRGELVPPKLETTGPDKDQRVVRRELGGPRQGFLRLGVEGRIGRFADALEEGEAEIAEGDWVVGARGDAVAEARQLGQRAGLGRRGGQWRRGRGRRGQSGRRDHRWRRVCHAAPDEHEAEDEGAGRAA
jgi:hypothetical protein